MLLFYILRKNIKRTPNKKAIGYLIYPKIILNSLQALI